MANVMSLKELRNHPSQNGFSLDKRTLFTANAGELLPFYVKEIIPGDSFDIDIKSFTRTAPLQTAAMTRLREHVNFYFVPTNLLWNKFNQFITQATENNQSAYSISGNSLLSDEHPYLTMKQLVDYYAALFGTDIMGRQRKHMTRKLLMYLGYGDMDAYVEAENYANVKLNPFPILAYQKVYSDHFRDSQWEVASARSFNLNYMSGQQGTNNIPLSDAGGYWSGLELRYVNWQKDLFTGILPRTQFGSSASVDLSSIVNPSVVSDFRLIFPNVSSGSVELFNNRLHVENAESGSLWNLNVQTVSNIASAIGLTTENLQSAFTVLALRLAEAKQKWAEISQSVQQDYQSQMKAHFDVNLASYYSDRCVHLGGTTSTIDINEVVNQNLQQNGANAYIQGKGVGVNSGNIKFSSDVHGYVIGVYHVTPMLDYALSTSLPRQLQKTNVLDYAIPEFDRVGMTSLPLNELTNITSFNNFQGELLGYVPRYYDYKTDVDVVLGGFLAGGLDDWVAPVSERYLRNLLLSQGANGLGKVDYRWFKVNPSILDSIFGMSVGDSFFNDHFRVNMSLEIRAKRKLDRDGLPY